MSETEAAPQKRDRALKKLRIFDPRRNPRRPRAHVIIAVLGERGRNHAGKFSDSKRYMTVFCDHLRELGCAVTVAEFDAVEAHLRHERTIIVNILNETTQQEEMRAAPRFSDTRIKGVWNSLEVATAVSSKRHCHRLYQACGAPGLTLAGADARPGSRYFSLPDIGHSSDITALAGPEAEADPARFTSEFVDSTTEFQGKAYFCSTRLLTVGGSLVGGMVRARPVEEGYSVHLGDTPKDPALLRFLHARHYAPHLDFFRRLARDIAQACGPGFFAHDLIPCTRTGRYVICESNLKFQTGALKHFRDVQEELRDLSPCFREDFDQISVEAFVAENRRLGWLD